MLVKVVLSYYMEGEHSQGASNPRVSGSGGKWDAWGKEAFGSGFSVRVLRLRRAFGLSTPRERETGPGGESRLTGVRDCGRLRLREARCREGLMPDGRCGSVDVLGCWDRWETRRPVLTPPLFVLPRVRFMDTAWGRLAVPGPSG